MEKKILNILVETRKKKNLTQKRVAELIGIDATHLSAIEHGRSILSLRRFLQLCEVLEIRTSYVFEEVRKNPVREEVLLSLINRLMPGEVELLLGIAQLMRDGRNLRP